MSAREEFITGLRQLADFLTVNPDVPVPASHHSMSMQLSALGPDDDAKIRIVDEFALASGAEASWDDAGEHYEAGLRFGPIKYFALAITEAHLHDYREAQRLGAEALERQKAEAAARVIDGEVIDTLEIEEPRPRGWLVEA